MFKIFSFARKTLLEYLREPLLWGLVLAFPPLLVAIFYFTFGQASQGLSQTLRLLVINQDAGPRGAELVELLRQAEFDGQRVFDVNLLTDRAIAGNNLRENKAALLLTVPADFSQALQGGQPAAAPSRVTLIGDTASFNYIFAKGFAQGAVPLFVRQALGQPAPAEVAYEFLPGTGTLSDYDFMVPGVIVFGVLFVTISTATTLVREDVAHTLLRLRLTRAGAAHMLLGVALAQLVVVGLQLLASFGVAMLCGFGKRGNIPPASILVAIGAGLLLALPVIGIGLAVAAFSRNDGDATNLGTMALIPLAFLSGAMYPMPSAPLGVIAGQTISLYDLMPSAHAAEIMRRVLVFGDGPDKFGYQLLMLLLLTVGYLAVGIALYQKFKLAKA